jgi:16S rRNA (uracil1498-N3)-methyltransferase
MHRFFIPPEWIRHNEVTVTGPQARQMARVLRLRPGDRVVVLDDSGWEIHTRLILVNQDEVRGEVLRRRLANAEPRTKISLYQGVLKSNRFEYALQKGTELGLVEFIPVVAQRCIMHDLEAVEKKRRRWESIIQEAAEQSRRGRTPALRAATFFAQAGEQAKHSGGVSLIPWEEKGLPDLRSLLQNAPPSQTRAWPPLTINIFIGPEGGFTPDEIAIRAPGRLAVQQAPQ